MNRLQSSPKPTVLLAPLDWGLGHATRCIPVIHQLLHQHCDVMLAGNGKGKALLAQEFPQLPFLELKGYDISYARSGWTLPFAMAAQIPKILSAIRYENKWLQDVVKQYPIHAVISDNRYGLYHPGLPTVFLTHQLLIKTSFGRQADRYLQKLNYDYINQFGECWVPDSAGDDNLAGDLSHPLQEPSIPLHYLGPLSRFNAAGSEVPSRHLLLLLSGPEPQRSQLEAIFLKELQGYKVPAVLVRGLPGTQLPIAAPPSVAVYDHLPAKALQEKIEQASFVVGRCGYSTIMDLVALRKKSILVPTPGQTEQEYLSAHLLRQQLALCLAQGKFRLLPALQLAQSFPYRFPDLQAGNQLPGAIARLRYKAGPAPAAE